MRAALLILALVAGCCPVLAAAPAPSATPVPSRLPTVAEARAWALKELGRREYDCLAAIVQGESGWDPLARNPSSGAFGLPQALHGLTTPDPIAQLAWMIRYVDRRYGSACRALAFWVVHRWY